MFFKNGKRSIVDDAIVGKLQLFMRGHLGCDPRLCMIHGPAARKKMRQIRLPWNSPLRFLLKTLRIP